MSAAGASHAPAPLPPFSRVAIPLPVEAIVVDHTLFQKWTKAGYDVVWIVPAGTPMLGRTSNLTKSPLVQRNPLQVFLTVSSISRFRPAERLPAD